MEPACTITPRRFDYPQNHSHPKYWYDGAAVPTFHLNVLAAYIPHGEKFFINSVKKYLPKIQAPLLKKEVKAFLQQEAHHAKTHQLFFTHAIQQYYPQLDVTQYRFRIIEFFALLGGKRMRLAMTAAGEHYTAIVAHTFLNHPTLLEKMPDNIANLWRWHFIEEIEHKAVAFDVMKAMQIGYLTRVTGFVLMSLFLVRCYIRPFLHMAKKDQLLTKISFWRDTFTFLWIRPGISRKSFMHYIAYLKPGFHPWKQNNRNLIQKYEL